MKPIRLFRHINCGSPGYLDQFLDNHDIPFEIVCVEDTSPIPDSLDDISGLVIMGGPGDVNSPVGWMRQEEALIRRAAALSLPVMGICLGGQMIARAMGGQVSSDYRLEVGWHHVEPVAGAENQSWLQGLPPRLEVFQWHAHEFQIPPGATPLLSSRCTPCQAFAMGNMLAMQFHLEVTAETVRSLTREYSGDMHKQSSCVQQAGELCHQLEERLDGLHRMADLIYSNWLARVENH
jgi:GMP synthase-like glutamine amidotransferase